jgi:REP element-mobilizing transposase RayT
MPRSKRIISSEHPYHLTARCINRDWFKIPIDDVWKVFEDHLYAAHHFYDVRIHSFVLMENHFHLLASFPKGNISEAMWYLMFETSRELTYISKRINQTYGGPHHPSLIATNEHFLNAYRYVYRNPVDAGVSKRVETYRYSTLHGLLGLSKLIIPVEPDPFLGNSTEETLNWLNTEYKSRERLLVKSALRKPQFELGNNRSTRKPNAIAADNNALLLPTGAAHLLVVNQNVRRARSWKPPEFSIETESALSSLIERPSMN